MSACTQDNTSFALETALEEMPSFYKERAAANIDDYLDSSGHIQLIVEHIPQVTWIHHYWQHLAHHRGSACQPAQ